MYCSRDINAGLESQYGNSAHGMLLQCFKSIFVWTLLVLPSPMAATAALACHTVAADVLNLPPPAVATRRWARTGSMGTR